MSYLYVTDQGAIVHLKAGKLEVHKENEQLALMPLKEVEALVLFGGVQVSTQAMLALLDKGADIAMMTKNGHFRGRMVSAQGKNSELREKQYQRFAKPEERLEFSKIYVKAKAQNSLGVLMEYHYNTNNTFRISETDKRQIKNLINSAALAENLNSLRGYEGAVARLYFKNLSNCFIDEVKFEGRKYFPSPDPVNALLSFGYSFVARELQSVLDALGLDPYIGFFHEIKYGRASLSLDLIEEFRQPVIDKLILKVFNKRILTEEDFEQKNEFGQCYLKRESQRVFIKYYEELADSDNITYGAKDSVSWRKIFWKQAEQLRRCIENNTVYTPYLFYTEEADESNLK